jgi:GDP-L-fucose synthase
MKKTLITGGSGLVGYQFDDSYHKISSKDYDLRDNSQVKELFENNQFEKVIHCAARVGGLGANIKYKGEFFYDNIMMNTNVIENARKFNVKKLICMLSTCVFPENIEYPLTENKMHLGEPHHSNYPYAYSKRMADIQIRAYNEQYGLNYTSLIPTNIYGPNDNFSLDNGHVIPTLIHKLYIAKKNKEDFVVWGSGNPLRQFIFSKDVAHLINWAIDNYEDSEPLIIGPDDEISIKDLINILVDVFEFTGKIIFDKSKPDGQFKKPADNSKLKKLYPEFKFTPLEKGIRETVEWFLSQYPNIRK